MPIQRHRVDMSLEGVLIGHKRVYSRHLCKVEGHDHVCQIAAHQHHVGRLDSHVCACTDGDAEVGSRERGRVVDAVTDHGHGLTHSLQLLHFRHLVTHGNDGEELQYVRKGYYTMSVIPRTGLGCVIHSPCPAA